VLILEKDDIWECLRCGECCKRFVRTGVSVTEQEWNILEEETKKLGLDPDVVHHARDTKTLPITGKTPPKTCAFLETAKCAIYNKRPQKCKEYPIMIKQFEKVLEFHIDTDCPRGQRIAKVLKDNPPCWLKNIIGDKNFEVCTASFFDRSMSHYLAEEY